ncbi:MAG: SurA N-terminal domain-containing protein [Burkholderiales bacterium]|nr:SurA N-terminal domain-containing protein [Burkholderiales bacterium]
MFEFIRTHQRLMQFLLLVLIVPPFAFFGIDGYKQFTEDTGALAKVAGHTITQQEYAQAQRDQMERQRDVARSLNVPFDAASLDTPAARAAVLDSLVNQRALTTYAVRRGVVITDDYLREFIAAIPALQEGGQFSKERYARLLAAQGLTAESFEMRLRQDLSLQALNKGVAETGFAPRAVQEAVARAQSEEREIQELVIRSDAFAGGVKLAPEAARAYYDANQAAFMQPAQARVEYVVLSVDAIAAGLTPPPEEVKAYYDQNAAKYRQEEQRQASHILVKAEPGADRSAARARAEELLKQARAPGADFAALAKKHSQDPISAAQGGSLGSFGRGAMVKAFEDAVFAMKPGAISDLVESEFGFHIIRLAAVTPAQVRSLDEVRGEIEKEWSRREAQKRFTEAAEGFTNIVYEQADSLKPAADKYKLKIATAGPFARTAPPKEVSHPRVLERLFADDAVKARRNTEAVEVAPGTLMSARVVDYAPQALRPFEAVSAAIVEQLTRKEAAALARKEGEARLAKLRETADAAGFGAAKTVSRSKPEGLSGEALRAVMAAPATKLPTVIGVPIGAGYALLRINKVSAGAAAEPARLSAIRLALDRAQAEGDFSAYLESVKAGAKVVVFKENLEKKSN